MSDLLHTHITITFVDVLTDEAFASTDMPADRLPESFAIDTQLSLGDDLWAVVSAEPVERVQCIATGALELRVQRVHMLSPQEILFSMPTICDALPPLAHTPLRGNEVLLHEDDWRQVEFVSQSFHAHMEETLTHIRAIHTTSAEGAGFRSLHTRTLDPPLEADLPLTWLARHFSASDIRGVTFHGEQAPVLNGFAIILGEVTLYGLAPSGIVSVLALHPHVPALSQQDIGELHAIAIQRDWTLVDWCRAEHIELGQ